VEQGADIHKMNRDGETPFNIAIISRHGDIIRYLYAIINNNNNLLEE